VNKKTAKVIFAILLTVAFALFAKLYTNAYTTAPEKLQDLYFAIGLSSAGILFHFLKNHPKATKGSKMTMESIELLMLIMTPIVVSFRILKDIFPNNPWAIIVPTILGLSSWYIVTLIRTSREGDEKDGKFAYSLTTYIYWALMVSIVLLIVLLLLFIH